MGCRVGMSTNPQERIDHWKAEEGHTGSKILAGNLGYDEAQKREEAEATARGCHHRPGAVRNGLRNWSVYYVWGGTVPKH